jgi:hypothetical protein
VLCDQQIVGFWTIKDILGHLVSWNREFRDNIAMILDEVGSSRVRSPN